ncbi:YrzI family small protein [Neobacillus niacini]|nr:YrzI family small protein [Neobacillus niacini]
MTLNIFFFTISIKKRDLSLDEAIHREVVEKRMQESMDRNIQIMGRY